MDKKREIFIKIEKTAEIIEILQLVKAKEVEIKKLFDVHDKLSQQENKIFSNWGTNLDNIYQKLEHVTL